MKYAMIHKMHTEHVTIYNHYIILYNQIRSSSHLLLRHMSSDGELVTVCSPSSLLLGALQHGS